MRVAPVGAYFADDYGRVVDQARASALATHTHPEGIAGAVFQSGQAQMIADVKRDPQHLGSIGRVGHATRDLLSVPLKRWGGAPIGVLNVINKRRGTFDADDLTLLTVLGALAATAIQQAEAFEEAKLAEVARAIGDVGHDLKNLLTPVLSSADLLSEELAELFARPEIAGSAELALSRELSTEAIRLIQRTGERIHHRVREIADCVKGRSSPPEFVSCDLAALARDVLATLSRAAKSAGVALDLKGFESPPEILADPNRLYSALYNLVANAIPEVKSGGTVLLALRSVADAVELRVIDTGRGMAPELCARLFTGAVSSTKRGGTGLGLRIARDAVLAHGGAIAVESVVGIGTTFTLTLPRRPPTA
jgi:signal transduction histidine kinase